MNLDRFIQPLRGPIKSIVRASEELDEPRRELLTDAAAAIRDLMDEHRSGLTLNFICTHNSRRSQLCELWATVAAAGYECDGLEFCSGGTEVTACNPRIVASLRRSGFSVTTSEVERSNPTWHAQYSDANVPVELFSKTFSDAVADEAPFAAMMCCDHADQNCPVIFGSVTRVALHYRDPKESDDTEHESAIYDQRRDEIAAEMFFLIRSIAGETE